MPTYSSHVISGKVNEEMELIRSSIRENVNKFTLGGFRSSNAEQEENIDRVPVVFVFLFVVVVVFGALM